MLCFTGHKTENNAPRWSIVSIQSGAHFVCLKNAFTKHPLIVLQVDWVEEGRPHWAERHFETYLQYIYCVLCASFWRSFSLIIQFMFIYFYQNSIAQHAQHCECYQFFSLQYASIKKNDECFVSPDKDFVRYFLHVPHNYVAMRWDHKAAGWSDGPGERWFGFLIFNWYY